MNSKSTWLMVVAAAALFVLIYFVERPIRDARDRPEDRSVLVGVEPAHVTAIEAQSAGHVIRFERSNDIWELTQPVVYPADPAQMAELLKALSQWQWQSVIGPDELKNQPKFLTDYGFDNPQFSLLVHAAEREWRLTVGKITATGDQVYLNVPGNDRIYVGDADILKLFPAAPDQWRDATVLHLDATPFQTLKVSSVNSPLMTFELDPMSRNWMMTNPVHARADSEKINTLLAQLGKLRVNRFVSDDPQGPGLPQPSQLKLTFYQSTNVVMDLEVGASATNTPGYAWARRQSPANIIEIATGPVVGWEAPHTNFLDRHLISMSPSLIDSIHVSGLDDFAVQKNAEGRWQVAGTESFPADELLMREWLSALSNLQVNIEVAVDPAFASYGLEAPAKPLLDYRLQFAPPNGQTNRPTAELVFGTNQTGRIFERRTDEKAVNSITPDQFQRLPIVSWELRDRSIWRFESNEVAGITIHQDGFERRMIRDPDNQWTFAPGSVGMINPPAIEEALYQMGRLRAVYWSGEGDGHLERFGLGKTNYAISFEIKRDGGMVTNSIEFGAESQPYGHPYASVVRNGTRLIFEFPIDLYLGQMTTYLGIPKDARRPL